MNKKGREFFSFLSSGLNLPLICINLFFAAFAVAICLSLRKSTIISPEVIGALCCAGVFGYSIIVVWVIHRTKYLPLEKSLVDTAEKLEENQNQLQSILNSIPDIIYYKDPDGKYLGANSAFQEYVGVYGEDIIGMTDADFFKPDLIKEYQMKEMEIMCSCMLNVSEETVAFPCGVTKQLEVIKVPYFDDHGALLGLIAIGRDIAERKTLEESLVMARKKAEAATRARSEFLANMSHEIRTPMNGVVTMAELICDQKLTAKAEECAVTIRDSSKILLGILNDILDFSKLEEGKLAINEEPFSCKNMIRDITALYSSRADAKGIVLTYQYSEDTPLYACGDELRIRQILGNLVANAIKFCSEGAVDIEVNQSEEMWSFNVKDTGIGMDNEQLQRVFDKFEQAHSSIGKRFGGTGLGLAISKKLARLMNGTLTAESEVGEGSVFALNLPLKEADESQVEAEYIDDVREVELGAYILLADDNKYNKGAFSMFFEDKLGCSVDWAQNGEEAVEMVKNEVYDMVFMDCHMPVMDGLEATRLIREFNPEIPIIALTADIMPEVREACMQAGMNDFTTKPFDLRHLEQLALKFSGTGETSPQMEPLVVADTDVYFDAVVFEGFFGDDYDGLIETLESFIEETDVRIDSFEHYISNNEFGRLREEAHGLKGAFGIVGGMSLTKNFSELQNAAETEDEKGCRSALGVIDTKYASFKEEGRAYLAALS